MDYGLLSSLIYRFRATIYLLLGSRKDSFKIRTGHSGAANQNRLKLWRWCVEIEPQRFPTPRYGGVRSQVRDLQWILWQGMSWQRLFERLSDSISMWRREYLAAM